MEGGGVMMQEGAGLTPEGNDSPIYTRNTI